MRAVDVETSVVATDPFCTCSHPTSWHLRHGNERGGWVRLGRCLVKVKNDRGFPVACSCRTYKAAKVRAKT